MLYCSLVQHFETHLIIERDDTYVEHSDEITAKKWRPPIMKYRPKFECVLESLRVRKRTDTDNIHLELLKNGGDSLKNIIMNMCDCNEKGNFQNTVLKELERQELALIT